MHVLEKDLDIPFENIPQNLYEALKKL